MKSALAVVFSLLACAATATDELSLARGRVEAVQNGRLTFESGGSVVLKSMSAEYSSGMRLLPPSGKTALSAWPLPSRQGA